MNNMNNIQHYNDGINKIEEKIKPLKKCLMVHPIYKHIKDEKTLRQFMENHIFSVWDFQSLLKSLQKNLSCIEIPWRPTQNKEARRLINEIVLDEESGNHPDGGYASHFELYREAMLDAGADVTRIDKLIKKIDKCSDVNEIIDENVSENASQFVKFTFKYINANNLCELMSIFTFGREDIIPSMFEKIIGSFSDKNKKNWEKFKFYLKEHITCDSDRHGPMAKNILKIICKNNTEKWKIAENSAVESLKQRIIMWDNIVQSIKY